MGALAFRTAVKAPTITGIAATSTSRLDPTWAWPAGFSIALTELEYSPNGSSGWTQIYSGTALTFAHTGLTANVTYYYRARVKDAQGNYSPYSNVSSQTTPNPNWKKWNPGMWVFSTTVGSYSSSAIAETGAMANCVGWKIMAKWSDIETSRGVYNFAFVDTLLALCKANNQRLVIEVPCTHFSGGNPLPAYLTTEANGGGGWFINSTGFYHAKVYLQAIMDRYLALASAFGQRYDTDAKFEGFMLMDESSIPQGTLQSDYSESKWLTQYLRMVTALPTYFQHSNVWTGLNFGFPTSSNFATILAAMDTSGCGFRAPDGYIDSSDNTTIADQYLRGTQGGIDYRSRIAVSHDMQGPELGGKENPSSGTSITTLYNQSYNTHRDHHLFWLYKNFTLAPTPPNDIYWDNTKSYATAPLAGSQDIKTFINAGNPTRTGAPSAYSGYLIVTGG